VVDRETLATTVHVVASPVTSAAIAQDTVVGAPR